MSITFEELLNDNTIGNFDAYFYIKKYVLKQISRCRFDIFNDKCYVKAKYKDKKVQVIISNDTSVYEFLKQISFVYGEETTPKFMYLKLNSYEGTLIERLKFYKTKNFVRGDELKYQRLYKMYSREPINTKIRELYDATWIDYETQRKNMGNIIYDDGIAGLWAQPADTLLKCLNNTCMSRYGDRVFIVEPIIECFYLDVGKEIIGEKYKVIDSLSLCDIEDIGKLINNYLLQDDKIEIQKLLADNKEENERLVKENRFYWEKNEELWHINSVLAKRNVIVFILGIIIGFIIALLLLSYCI
jgi:hypothetical protein